MRYINMETWPRRQHFDFFRAFDHPHFSMCTNVDLTTFYRVVKQHGYSITVAIVYAISRAANAIPEFRYRIRGEKVVEHETVNPSTTILTRDNLFTFCTMDYMEGFALFSARAAKQIAYVQEHPVVENVPGKDDLLFMTAIPWVSFTSFMHPVHLHPADSIPRFAWGKFFAEGERLKMPLDVLVHHAIMDGYHVGQFYTIVQDYFSHPEAVLIAN
jgi:chloramphenicol O-acetyltransferase type A